MSTKRVLSLFFVIVCCAVAAIAMPAKPGWHTISQSDGTTLTVKTVGNAFNHAILTTDGLTVARGSDGDFYYISSLTGLTTVRAHDENMRTATETAFIKAQRGNLTKVNKSFVTQPKSGVTFGVGGSNADADVPSNGNRKVPIILVEFSDKKFSNTREEIIEAMLMGNKSVQQYFRDQSNGLYDPDFEVFGIYTLSQNRQYYGGNSGGNDKALGSFVTEAVQLAAADGVSFQPFDTNSDNYCDVVIVIYAGVGEAQASYSHPESIWPCNWNLNSASYYGMGGNGAFRPNPGDPYVNNFAVFNELHGSNDNTKTIDGIGTFCHEFGHCLGLPDFYDTNYGNHYGMGTWDIMDTGCYNDDTYTPVGYSAYEKVFMGWIDYVTPRPGTYYTLPVMNQKAAETDKALCILSDINPNEFFIIENRRKQGWDAYMAGQGLLITHVTYSASRWAENTPNNENIQLMTIMPADNSLSSNNENKDLWPQTGKTEFTDNSTPAAKLNMTANGSISGNAGYLGKPVTEMVINADGTASFWYMKGAVTDPTITVLTETVNCGSVMANNTVTKSFTVSGQLLTDDINLTLTDENGVFTIDPTVINATDATMGVNVTVTFTPVAVGDYHATVTLTSNGAETVTVNLTGEGLLEKYTPVMLPANEEYINLTQFRADWTDQTPEQNVASYTLEVMAKPDGPVVVEGGVCDMSDVEAVTNESGSLPNVVNNATDYLPTGWTAENSLYVNNGCIITGATSSWWGTTTYGAIVSPVLDLTDYDKITVVARVKSFHPSSYGVGQVRISTGSAYQDYTLSSSDEDDFQEIIAVLNCSTTDQVRVQAQANYISIESIYIYAGDINNAKLAANETGDADYRLITDITDRFYTVQNLTAEGTYIYKVKAVYTDGTESTWSNKQEVTLFQNGHGFEPGDVNHDGRLNISDVTDLISILLSGITADGPCAICADVNGDGKLSIADVTALISLLLQ